MYRSRTARAKYNQTNSAETSLKIHEEKKLSYKSTHDQQLIHVLISLIIEYQLGAIFPFHYSVGNLVFAMLQLVEKDKYPGSWKTFGHKKWHLIGRCGIPLPLMSYNFKLFKLHSRGWLLIHLNHHHPPARRAGSFVNKNHKGHKRKSPLTPTRNPENPLTKMKPPTHSCLWEPQ